MKLGLWMRKEEQLLTLKNALEVAKHRVIFINTGFLDRTGDEIHTSMEVDQWLQKPT